MSGRYGISMMAELAAMAVGLWLFVRRLFNCSLVILLVTLSGVSAAHAEVVFSNLSVSPVSGIVGDNGTLSVTFRGSVNTGTGDAVAQLWILEGNSPLAEENYPISYNPRTGLPVNTTRTINSSIALSPGTHRLRVEVSTEMGSVASSQDFLINVNPQTNGAAFVSHNVPSSMLAGRTYPVSLTFTNTGTTTWNPGGAKPHRLGAQNPQDNLIWGVHRVELPSSVAPGASVTFNFTVQAPSAAGTYNFQWGMLQEGTGWFGGLSSNTAVSVAESPPTVSLTSPSNGAQFTTSSTATVSLAGNAAGTGGASIVRLEFFDGATSLGSTASTSLSLSSQMALGSHRIELRATDSFNKTASAFSTITVGAPAPTATLDAPTDGSTHVITSGQTTNVQVVGTGTVSPNTSLARIEVLDGGVSIHTQTSGTSVNVALPLGSGIHSLQLRTTDNLGSSTTSNAARVTVVFLADLPPPTVSLTSPVNGAQLTTSSTATVSLAGSAAGVGGASITRLEFFDGTTSLGSTASTSLSLTSQMAPGSHRIELRATDSYTKTASVFSTITIGAPAPTATLSAPTDGSTHVITSGQTTNVQVVGTGAVAPNTSLARIEVLDGGVPIHTQTSGTSVNVALPLGSGVHSLQLRTTDSLGSSTTSNAARVTVVFLADLPPPTVSLTSPANGTQLTTSSTATVSLAGSAAGVGGASITRLEFFDGTTSLGSTASTSLSLTSQMAPGSHRIELRATDSYTKTASVFSTITIGAPAPTATLSAPTDGSTHVITSGQTTNVQVVGTGTVSPNTSLARIEVLDGGVPIHAQTSGTSVNVVLPLGSGVHPLQLRTTDSLGSSTTSDTVRVTVVLFGELPPPLVSLTSPVNGAQFTTTSTATVSLAGSAVGTGGASIVRLEFFDGATSLGSTASISLSLSSQMALGSHRIELRATDSFNKTASAFSTITVGAPAPTATLDAPTDGSTHVITSGQTTNVQVVGTGTVAPNTSLARIEVLDGGVPIHTQTSGTSVNVALPLGSGVHSLQLRTTDSLGSSTTSNVLRITVVSSTDATPVPIVIDVPQLNNGNGGSLPGEVTVGTDGGASYAIPIQVPPGVMGMIPNIALTYSSNNPGGLAGFGWQISGISHIDRCGKVVATDGKGDGVRFLDNTSSLNALNNPLPVDRLCLDGMRLVLANGSVSDDNSYWVDGAEYRTEVESFSRITALTVNGKRAFKVQTKDGRTSYYGNTADSYIEGAGRTDGLAHRWYVSRTEDRSNNTMAFTYSEDTTTGEVVPASISWGANSAAGTSHFARVNFTYEDRPDPRIAYIAGSRLDQRKRLKTITTSADTSADSSGSWTTALEYTLAYSVSPTSGRSRLDSVTACDSLGCLPKTSFTWGEPDGSAQRGFVALGAARTGPDLTALVQGTGFNYGQVFIAADFDGDGKTDLLERTGTTGPGTQRLYSSNADGTSWTVKSLFVSDVSRVLEAADFDGDGLIDFLVTSSNNQWKICFGKNQIPIGSRGNPVFGYGCNAPLVLPGGIIQQELPQLRLRVVRDFNADGKDDLFAITSYDAPSRRAYQCLSNGVTFDCIDVTGTRDEKDMGLDYRGEPFSPSAYTDVDGDGRVDTVLIPKCEYSIPEFERKARWHCGTTGGSGEAGGVIAFSEAERGAVNVFGEWLPFPNVMTGVAPPMSYASLVGDHNGDGYSDMVMGVLDLQSNGGVSGGSGSLCLSRGNGSGDCRALPSASIIGGADRSYLAVTVGDFDGDGVIDVLRPQNDTWNSANVTGYQMCRIGTDANASTDELPLFQRCESWTGPTFYARSQRNAYATGDAVTTIPMSMMLGDFDGDGRQDIATYQGGNQWQIYTAVSQAKTNEALDRLITVTNGLGRVERVDYALSNDRNVYRPDVSRPDAQNKVGKLATPTRPLVKALHRDSGIAGVQDTTYSYGRFAMDAQGRGALGFAELVTTNVQRGMTSTTWPCLAFPHIGAECASRQMTTGGVELNSTSNVWSTKVYPKSSGGLTSQPYLSSSTVSRHDPNGGDLGKQVVTNSELDDWGNIGLTTTVNSLANGANAWTVTMRRTFDNNESSWRIGELRSNTETRTNDHGTIARKTVYTYDGAGLLATETRDIADNTQRLQTSYDRSTTRFGLVGKTTLAWTDNTNTARTRIVSDVIYTSNGRFIGSVTNAAGQVEQRTFDARIGTPVMVTSSNGLSISTVSDGFGRTTSVTAPDGNIVQTSYKRCDQNCPGGAGMVQVQDTRRADGTRSAVPVLQFADTSGRVVRQTSWGFDGRYLVTDTIHDVLGRVEKTYWPRHATSTEALSALSPEPAGAVLQSSSSYDVLDRPLVQQGVAEDGSTLDTTHTWTGLTHQTRNPKQQTITETRDVWGKLATTIDANNRTTTFEFDAFGNLAKTTDPLGNKVEVVYDTWGRRTKLIDPDLGTITYEVDALGQTWKQVSPKQRSANKSTVMAYDVLGRMVTRTAEDVSAAWTYDIMPGQSNCAAHKSCGKLVRAATLTGTAALDYHQDFTFDALGRPDTTMRYLDVVYTSKLGYDAWGRLSREQHQRGSGTTKVYDRRYNAWGQMARIERNGIAIWTATAQDASSRVTNAALGNGLELVSTFNPNTGRLTDGTVKASAALRLHEAYQYDKLGNVSQRLQEWGSTSFIENFDYDQLNRLKSSTIVGYGGQAFTYDDIGNLKSKTGVGSGDYVYPAAGSQRPHAVSSIPGIGSFNYDDNGNMLSGAGRTVTWTSFDMPLTIAKGSASSTFHYGADYERVKQVANGVTTWYAGAIEVETNGGAVKVKTYLPGSLGVEIDSNGSTKLYYTHCDRLGSVMALSDEAGNLSEQLAYDAWGKRREKATPSVPDSIDGQVDNKGFTGHEMLDALDLVHMNGRVYDPLVARFMSADAVIQEPEHSQSYNRYTYVWNNPTNLTDPTGFVVNRTDSAQIQNCAESVGCQTDGRTTWTQGSSDDSTGQVRSPGKDATGGNGGRNTQAQNSYGSTNTGTNVIAGLGPVLPIAPPQDAPKIPAPQEGVESICPECYVVGAIGGAMRAIGVKLGLQSIEKAAVVSGAETGAAALARTGEETVRVGRWMSRAEYAAMKDTGRLQEGAGGMTSMATSGPASFVKQTQTGNVYVEFTIARNSVVQGGQADWLTGVSANASRSMQSVIKKQGGELSPTVTNISIIQAVK